MPNCDTQAISNAINNHNHNDNSNNMSNRGGYKDVVIIGNGPSGLCLSYFLSGHWPYWNKREVSDEYLQRRLEYSDTGLSLVEQDLEYLSDGLEGRSMNPVALLYDKLKHPDGDLGIDSPTCLNWKYDPLKEIDHVVIGKTAGPGGSWNDLDGTSLTISPSRWMELPDMSFSDWQRQSKAHQTNMNAGIVFSSKSSNFAEDNSLLNGQYTRRPFATPSATAAAFYAKQMSSEDVRASMHDIRCYYSDYVKQKNLDRYLLNNATVTSVRRVNCSKLIDQHCAPTVNCAPGETASSTGTILWEVRGIIDKRDRKRASSLTHKGDLMEFHYICKHLVLASGASDYHNSLNVKGEAQSRYVLRSIRELEECIKDDLPRFQKAPLLIIGSGLSAADAIILAQKHRIKIVHVIRRSVTDQKLVFPKLPKLVYPEYHRVYEWMLKYRHEPNKVEPNEANKHMNQSDAKTSSSSPDRITDYVMYDECQVKCFKSKRTCILVRTPIDTVAAPIPHRIHTNSTKSNGHYHQTLNDFDEELLDEVPSSPEATQTHKSALLSDNEFEVKFSYACVLIGYSADLDFLPPTLKNQLASHLSKALDTKDNPIKVNSITHELTRCKSIFAMGPLIGDNFVRFGTGGALAIASALWKSRKAERQRTAAVAIANKSLSLANLSLNAALKVLPSIQPSLLRRNCSSDSSSLGDTEEVISSD